MISVHNKVMRSFCLLLLRALYLRARDESDDDEFRYVFGGESLLRKKRNDASLPLRYPPLSRTNNFDENDDRNNNNDTKQRQIRVVFFIVIRVESFRCRDDDRERRGEKTFRLRKKD